jgi:multicomponent Na+:H+ antiporter subunit A
VIGRRSEILDETDRVLFPVILLVSVYITFRGHNAPGGGFAGGLIAGAAFVLRFLAGGALKVRGSAITHPASFIGFGMLVAVGTAAAPLLFGDALLESTIWQPDVPGIGEVKIVSSSIFDVGVYFLVIGTVLAFLVALGADPIHRSVGSGDTGSDGDDPHTRADDWAMDHDTSADHATEEDHR